jgi:hypothetical protein
MVRPRSTTTALDRRSAPAAGASAPLAAAAGARAWWSEGQRPGAAAGGSRACARSGGAHALGCEAAPASACSLGSGSVQVYVAAARGSGGSALGR